MSVLVTLKGFSLLWTGSVGARKCFKNGTFNEWFVIINIEKLLSTLFHIPKSSIILLSQPLCILSSSDKVAYFFRVHINKVAEVSLHKLLRLLVLFFYDRGVFLKKIVLIKPKLLDLNGQLFKFELLYFLRST